MVSGEIQVQWKRTLQNKYPAFNLHLTFENEIMHLSILADKIKGNTMRLTSGFSFPMHLFCLLLFLPFAASGQDQRLVDPSLKGEIENVAPVTIDGEPLFFVKGILSYPAKLRAKSIEKRIHKIGQNSSITTASIHSVAEADRINILAGDEYIFSIFDADAQVEGASKEIFADFIVSKLQESIKDYRYRRSKPAIISSIIKALVALGLLVAILFVFNFFFKRLNEWFKRRMKSRIDKIENASYKLIQSDQLFQAFHLLYKILRMGIILTITVAFINYFLGLFPWSKGISVMVLNAVVTPLQNFGKGFVNYLPSFFVLVIIWIITKYLLKFIRLLFLEINRKAITIDGFDPDWAMPTFKIVRFLVIIFALVVAFPYIPGSDTSAFKGISVFLGVLFSLGSSSFIANIVAGFSLTYQNAFKRGDFIKVNEYEGFVESQSSMVTRLRSMKNQEIVIPNSILLNSNVINYSLKAKKHDLILYTTVGIGYETPWRLVDAMLKLAAKRTEGISRTPEPFVLKKALGDFAITYELNAYCLDEARMPHYYSLLHQNILDVFNENNVVIMTPAYRGDTTDPKLVPKDQWNPPLASEE